MANRLFHPNDDLILQSSTLLTTTGYDATFPPEFLRDQLRQKPIKWGAYVVDANNDKLDFNRGGVKVATLTHGTYTTPAAYGIMVAARLEAADATPVWSVTYNSTTKCFTIADTNLGNFDLLMQTGSNRHRTCFPDMGWDLDFADQTGTFTYTAIRKSYQSRKYLVVSAADGSALSASAAIIADHNMTLTGSSSVRSRVRIQGNTTDTWPVDGSLPMDEEFSDLADVNGLEDENVPCRLYFADGVQPFEFWRLVIDDVQNPDGYNRLGRFALTLYNDLTICIADSLASHPQDFSTGQEGPDGTRFANLRRRREVFEIGWNQADTTDHGYLMLFFRRIPAGRMWFFDFDTTSFSETYYGYFNEPPTRGFVPANYWDWQFTFFEAL